MSAIIAHVNVSRGFRGGERQTELLIRELAGGGMRQMLVARRNEPLAARLRDADVEIREVSGQVFAVAAALKGADLVHVHEGRSVYAAWLRHVFGRTPYVLTRRVDNPVKDHYFAHRAYRSAGAVAAVAPQVAQILRVYDPAINVCVVHSASSSLSHDAESVNAIRGRYKGKFIVGHIGALDIGQKAQDVIIEAARQLADSRPDLHFLLVGGGADREKLEAMAAGLANLSFVGFVENVGDYLEAFDLLILPSRKEGIGSILLDAMQHGLAVVAARVGGVPDIVTDGENGLLIDPDRPDQLAQAIIDLAGQPDLRRQFAIRGADIARQYTAAVMARKYREIYERLLNAH